MIETESQRTEYVTRFEKIKIAINVLYNSLEIAYSVCKEVSKSHKLIRVGKETYDTKKSNKYIRSKLKDLNLLKTTLIDKILNYLQTQDLLELRDICTYAETRYQSENAEAMEILKIVGNLKAKKAELEYTDAKHVKILTAIATALLIILLLLMYLNDERLRRF